MTNKIGRPSQGKDKGIVAASLDGQLREDFDLYQKETESSNSSIIRKALSFFFSHFFNKNT